MANKEIKKYQTSTKAYLNKRIAALDLERQSFIAHYKDLSEYIKPRRGRFFIQDRNKGTKRHQAIINSRGTKALQVARAGMLAGTMSPTRPWFVLETYDPDLMKQQQVKEWLYDVEHQIRQVFSESNYYSQAATILDELLLFGTGAMSHVDDYDDVARFYTHTAGSYYIAQDDKYKVNVFVREFELSVKQLVELFGYENCSLTVQRMYDVGDYENWIPVRHVIEPNELYDMNSKLSMKKKFKSVYYEPQRGEATDNDKMLEVKGYDEFPVHVARWDVTGEDIYGTDCPGMTALGDVKGLQIAEKRKAQAIDKMVNPPLTGPASFSNIPVSSLPGGLNLADTTGHGERLQAMYQIQPQVDKLREDILAIEKRIEEAYFVDLFLAISNMEGIQPRNQLDIIQRNEERLLQLGPVLEHLHGELLSPLITRTFNQGIRAGIFPPIPDALSGHPLKIRYISTLAMAQRAVASQNIERFAQFVGGLVGLGFGQAAQKFDTDQAINEFGRSIGAPPSIIVPDEVVQEQRAALAQKQAAAEALAAGQQAANITKMASESKTDGENVLTNVAKNANLSGFRPGAS